MTPACARRIRVSIFSCFSNGSVKCRKKRIVDSAGGMGGGRGERFVYGISQVSGTIPHVQGSVQVYLCQDIRPQIVNHNGAINLFASFPCDLKAVDLMHGCG